MRNLVALEGAATGGPVHELHGTELTSPPTALLIGGTPSLFPGSELAAIRAPLRAWRSSSVPQPSVLSTKSKSLAASNRPRPTAQSDQIDLGRDTAKQWASVHVPCIVWSW